MNKSRLIYSFSLFLSFVFILFAYQNCGEVGGTSPLDQFTDGSSDDEGNTSLNTLKIQSPNAAAIIDNRLEVTGSCTAVGDASTNKNGNILHWKVLESGVVKADSRNFSYNSSVCNGSTYSVVSDLGFSTRTDKTYTIQLELYALDFFGWEKSDSLVSTSKTIETQSVVYPESHRNTITYNNESWFNSGEDYRQIGLLDMLPANHKPYYAIDVKVKFRVNSEVSLHSTYMSIMELFPTGNSNYYVRPIVTRFAPNDDFLVSSHRFFVRDAYGNSTSRFDYDPNYANVNNQVNRILTPGTVYHLNIRFINHEFNTANYYFMISDASGESLTDQMSKSTGSSFTIGENGIFLRFGKTPDSNSDITKQNIFSLQKIDYALCGYTSPGVVDNSCWVN